jgi:hypothetical protein
MPYNKHLKLLRAKFAHIIQLIHPDEQKGWIINAEASGRAINCIKGLNQTEQRYTTCEKELLAIVYALQQFRIYIYGRKSHRQ